MKNGYFSSLSSFTEFNVTSSGTENAKPVNNVV